MGRRSSDFRLQASDSRSDLKPDSPNLKSNMVAIWAMLKKGNTLKSDLFLFFLERSKNASIFPK